MPLNRWKAQSAIEYLNIYTMAIIVIAVTTSIGYSQLEDECVENVEGFDSEQITITEYTTDNPDSTASMNIENQAFDITEVERFEVNSPEGQRILNVEEDEIGPGDDFLIDVPGIEDGQCQTINVMISTPESEIEGTITGSFEFLELELPEPPSNLEASL